MRRESRGLARPAIAAAVAAVAMACGLKLSRIEQADTYGAEPKVIPQIQAPPGFRVVRVAQGFNFPSSMTWDAAGRLYVLESHTVPVPSLDLRIMRLQDGRLSPLSLEGDNEP